MHLLPLQLRFNDIDMMGHVNNAIYLEFFDLGKEHFFASAEVDLYHQDFTMMIVHIDVDFCRQTHFSDRIGVTTEVARFGNKSVEFLQRIVQLDANGVMVADASPLAVCKTILSGYCRSTQHSAVIPDDVRQRMLQV
ncbi:MAG: acyl-CoA thioesterase [Bacteroidales bacterium]|nr:acyl-CoA thioesterase [Bacteroidales bacterium]